MTVQVYIKGSDEIIASVEIGDEVKGIVKDGYAISVDGEEVETATGYESFEEFKEAMERLETAPY